MGSRAYVCFPVSAAGHKVNSGRFPMEFPLALSSQVAETSPMNGHGTSRNESIVSISPF